MNRLSPLVLLVTILFISCEKEELPITAHSAGSAITSTVNMNVDYRYQIFFDLETNTAVGQCLKTSWDLGFETAADGIHIVLNAAKYMMSLNTGDTSFVSVTDTSGFSSGKTWDAPSGNLDSTAIGNWTVPLNTYIIDRGYSETGQHQGFRKVRFESVTTTNFTVRLANLNGSGEVVMTVPKDTACNFTFLSFSNGGQIVTVEPPKRDWDLMFTQFIHEFHDPTSTYLVTGCLLNRYNTHAVRDTIVEFTAIDFQSLENYTLSESINTIGYDWKTFNGTSYITDPAISYIILDQHAYYYKLHFIDFYDQSGVKGNPKWEFQRL